jgi:LuxR family quorum-sensing system transcriptional regulator CciR
MQAVRRLEFEEETRPSPELLSEREAEILTWVALGKSNTDIGTILRISPHTVNTYLKRILSKLEVTSRTTAAVRAAQMGLLPQV